jgi:transposase
MVDVTTVKSICQMGVGIDTARYGHHVSFLKEDRQQASAPIEIQESAQGYAKLRQTLTGLQEKQKDVHFHVRIDAAGQYAMNLEHFLRRLPLPMTISVGEPKRNKDYHKALFPKRKSDATESLAMARYAIIERPSAAPQVPEKFATLREITSRLQGQVKQTTRAVNQLHNLMSRVFPELAPLTSQFSSGWVLRLLQKYPTAEKIANARLRSLEKIPHLKGKTAQAVQTAARQTVGSSSGPNIECLVRQQVDQVSYSQKAEKQLLKLMVSAYEALPMSNHVQIETITGIGKATAAVLVAKIVSIDRFETPGRLVGYFGIFPEENTSGVNWEGKPHPSRTKGMSKKGNDLVRSYLWNASKSALQHNPAVRALYRKLRARGTRGDVAIGHCMQKLLHLVFAIWKSGKPFDKEHYPWEALESVPLTEASQSPEDTNKKAAGHKREVVPDQKVVTAATGKIERRSSAIKGQPMRRDVDFAHIRSQISIERVLQHQGLLDRLVGSGAQRRGPCPVHACDGDTKSRSFMVNLQKNVFRCLNPHCAIRGNTLDLWSAIHQKSPYEAALDLVATFYLQSRPNRDEATRDPVRKPR